MDTVRPASWRRLCLAGVALFASLAGMATVAGEARADNQVSAARASQAIGIGNAALNRDLTSLSTSLSAKSQVSTRARKPRVWKMPIPVARRTTLSLARIIYNETTPNEFDQSGSIIGKSDWDDYGAGTCKRQSKARVNCLGLVWSEFDILDDSGRIVGEDTFTCGWEQTTWYPRARVKRLKTQVVSQLCFWDSDI